MSRSVKFWRKNEEQVMHQLGLEPTPNSGAGWLIKEDGQSDELICQLKSTEAKQITIKKRDLEVLEFNAANVHKTPVFTIQFISQVNGKDESDIWLLLRPEDLKDIADNIIYQKPIERFLDMMLETLDDKPKQTVNKIKSSKGGRSKFFADRDKKFNKEVKAK